MPDEKFWEQVDFFEELEFDSPDEPGSGKHIDPEVVLVCDRARQAYGQPLFINSAVRTLDHNAEVGGVQDSAHLVQEDGVARGVDIRTPSSRARYCVLQEAFKSRIRRIGIGSNFIHLDNDKSKDQRVVWLYPR